MPDKRPCWWVGAGLFLSVFIVVTSAHSSNETTDSAALDLPASECVFSGNFQQQRVLDGLPEPLQSNGVFFYHCKHGIIWSTQAPIAEALVLRSNGSGFLLKDSQSKNLKSRQSKFLGKLLNDLMGSDPASIASQFDVERLDPQIRKYHLTPKKRAIKRGIKGITILLPNDNELDQKPAVITVIDRNAQATEIQSTRDEVFSVEHDAASSCDSAAGIAQQSCTLLLGRE